MGIPGIHSPADRPERPQTVLKGRTVFNLPLREHPYGGKSEKFKLGILRKLER